MLDKLEAGKTASLQAIHKYLFEDIVSLYEQNKQTGKPYFNFSVTYQNHGPYETQMLLTNKIYVEKCSR